MELRLTGPDWYTPEQAEARFKASLKLALKQPLSDEEWDAIELGPLCGDIVRKRPGK